MTTLGRENKFSVNSEEDISLNDGSNWICFEWFHQWSITPNRRGRGVPKKLGWLYVQITICDSNGEIGPCGCVPRIEVGYRTVGEDGFTTGSSFTTDGWAEYGIDKTGYCPSYPVEIWSDGGVPWNRKDVEWFFGVPLFCVNTLEDLDSMLIEPIIKLLKGGVPEAVFEKVPAFCFKIENDQLLPFAPLEISVSH